MWAKTKMDVNNNRPKSRMASRRQTPAGSLNTLTRMNIWHIAAKLPGGPSRHSFGQTKIYLNLVWRLADAKWRRGGPLSRFLSCLFSFFFPFRPLANFVLSGILGFVRTCYEPLSKIGSQGDSSEILNQKCSQTKRETSNVAS